MQVFNKINLYVNRALIFCGGVFLVGMVVLTCANIVLRAFGMPVRGTFELMGFFGAVTAAFALGYTQIRRGHVAVDVLMNTFSPATKRFLKVINNLVGLVFFLAIAWQVADKATVLKAAGEVTETLGMAYYPFVYCVAIGCAMLGLVFLADLANVLATGKGGRQ